MAGVLTVGGPDQIQIEQIFPSTQKSFLYNFNSNVSGWTFTVDQQTLILDTVTFDRSGTPSFDSSKVIGQFAKANIEGTFAPTVSNVAIGTVKVNIPANMYTGPIIPDARLDVPVTVVGVTWQDASVPPQINTHRWAFIQNWEPGVTVGDPTAADGYTAV
jgi:hypothetical protein